MSTHLAPCEACGRHIRVSETKCPFCDATTSATLRASPAPVAPPRTLSRAALLAFGAAATAAGVACSSSSTTSTPVYGAPADTGVPSDASDAGSDAGADSNDSGIPMPMYGGPFDTGTPDGADAAADTDASAMPAYGLPPPDTGGGG